MSACAGSEPWTEQQDLLLVTWGRALPDGYAYVAAHDLGRTEQEGRDRIALLRRERGEWVRGIEAVELVVESADV